jgi:integrase
VRVGELQNRPTKRKPHGVRWVVDGKPYSRWFLTKAPAGRFRSRIIGAHEDGERFDPATGEPESWRPDEGGRIPVYDWARRWLADEWPELAPRSRDSYVEALSRFVPLAVADDAPPPPKGTWRWLDGMLRPGAELGDDDEALERERWLRKWGLTLHDLDRPLLARVDVELGVGAEGRQLGAATAGRFRKYSRTCIRRAVELEKIPVDPWPQPRRGRSRRKANRVVEAVDIRGLPNPGGMRAILAALLERSQPYTGWIWYGLSGIGYYGGLRPSETIMLRRRAIHLAYLPAGGWSLIEVVEADDGYDNSADPKTGNRVVPLPPAGTALVYEFLAAHPVAPDELMFRTKKGTRPSLSSWRRALRRACCHVGAEVLTPYDLRDACATTMLSAGVPLGRAALWLGHSVKTLVAHYIQALDGDDQNAFERIEQAHG